MSSRGWLFVAVLAVACGASAARSDEQPIDARGRALLAPFKASLQQALKAGLADGPVTAVEACRLRAPEIAQAMSKDGNRVGRASHRLRNPDNVAPDWVAPVLERYLAEPASRKAATVRLADGRTGYVEPIVLAPLCVTCHGDALAPELAARISKLYPEDQAIGFQPGELRGVFWIEMTREASAR